MKRINLAYRESQATILQAVSRGKHTRPDIKQWTGMSDKSADNAILKLLERGELWRAGDRRHSHFFSSQAEAQAHDAGEPARREKRREESKRLEAARDARKRRRPVSQWVNVTAKPKPIKASPKQEIIVPADVKVIQGPSVSYDLRYQLEPGTRVLGGFATLGIGRYLEVA